MLYLHKTKTRLALKLFRGEPAISGFDWNFSPTHTSSPPFSTDVRSVLHCLYGNFNLTWVDHPVSGLRILTICRLFRLGFPSAPHLKCLTLPASATRRTVLQKVRGSSCKDVPQLVNTGFQVLFHSPPGVLFTFPSQYYALSVTKEYLGLRGGPRSFHQGFSCLDTASAQRSLSLTGLSPSPAGFPKPFRITGILKCGLNPGVHAPGLALSISLAATLEIDKFFSFLALLRCFQFRRFSSIRYGLERMDA